MAQDVTINGVDYPDVPAVSVPLTSGSGNALFLDASDYRTAADQDVIDSGKLNTSGGTVSGDLSITGKLQANGRLVLTEGVNFGTTAQRDALTSVANGTLFFVRS